MNKRYIIRGILLGSMLTTYMGGLTAQETVAKADTAAITVPADVPGRLFGTFKDNNTGAVSVVSGSTLYQTTTPNISNTLIGRLAGLTVTQGSGEPGNDNARWLIRGVGSYGYGGYNVCKLFVDGFEVNANYFTNLSASEIESISVLKDAASLATFGMRGSNGVIWVETKRGKVGKSTVQVQLRSGMQSATKINKPLGSYDFANLYNQAISNDNGMTWTPKYSTTDLTAYKNGTGVNVDWYDKAMKNYGAYNDADVIFNGGNSSARYNVVLDYANQQGLYNVSNTDQTSNINLARYNLRANLDFTMFGIFEAKVDLGGRLEDRKRPNYSTSGLMDDLSRYPSNIYNVYDGDTTLFSGTSVYPNNPVGSVKGLGWYSTHTRILQGNFGLKEKLDFITKGLYVNEAVSFNAYALSTYSKTKNYARYYNGATTTTDQTTTIVASGYGSGGQEMWTQGIVTLGYDGKFGAHSIASALNFHESDYRGDGFFGDKYHYQNISGRFNYNYDSRYVAEFGFSYFGNDAYAPGNQWGFYPTVSGAWIASNESFLKSSNVVNYLKVRASVGTTGGSDAGATGNLSSFSSNGRFLYQQYYSSSPVGSTYFGNGTPSGQGTLAPLFVANKNVFAEKSLKYNLGAEVTLFKKLDASVDVFMDKRSNILTLDNSLMGYYGYNYAFNNIGKMTNKGIEVTASYTDKVGEVGYTIHGMASYNKNKIDYMAEVTPANAFNAQTGRAFGTPIGLECDGFFQLSDFNADGSLKSGIAVPAFGAVQPGDLKYKDLDKNGVVDQNDVTSIGKTPYPELTYAFGGTVNYKGFDLTVFLQGTYGSSVNLLGSAYNQTVAFVNNGNAYEIAKDAWAYYPNQGIDTRATAKYPRLTTLGNTNNYRSSNFWMKSGDFLRVRNVELGYNFTPQLLGKIGLSKLRLYVNAINPITWSSLLKDYHIDPEIQSGYPALKSVNVGITATF
ncbi:MAG: SusC/RagA family TonB-linked outer membrane protein [Bacteroidota bacterium]|nr:SusC/RagA family TonB-linked outer membrane protein [Bacteroidota bacterium]